MAKYASSKDAMILEQLYDSCANDLYHFLLSLSDPATAKDIAQKTWLKVIEKPHLYQHSGSFIGWLFTLARNALIDELRREKRWSELPQDEQLSAPTPVAADDDINSAFDRVLTSLPFEQREAFCLQQEGFGLQDIASITHSGIETVKSRIRYAKQTLRARLEKYHD